MATQWPSHILCTASSDGLCSDISSRLDRSVSWVMVFRFGFDHCFWSVNSEGSNHADQVKQTHSQRNTFHSWVRQLLLHVFILFCLIHGWLPHRRAFCRLIFLRHLGSRCWTVFGRDSTCACLLSERAINEYYRKQLNSLLCSGQTGAGKSYTMMGPSGDDCGIIPRLCDELWQRIGTNSDKFEVHTQHNSAHCCNFCEIHLCA